MSHLNGHVNQPAQPLPVEPGQASPAPTQPRVDLLRKLADQLVSCCVGVAFTATGIAESLDGDPHPEVVQTVCTRFMELGLFLASDNAITQLARIAAQIDQERRDASESSPDTQVDQPDFVTPPPDQGGSDNPAKSAQPERPE